MKRFLIVITLLGLVIACHPLAGQATYGHSQDAPAASQGKPDVKVWVNTSSGIYHCPGTRWYGKTKRGEYMTQKQAQEKKYRPAYGKYCE